MKTNPLVDCLVVLAFPSLELLVVKLPNDKPLKTQFEERCVIRSPFDRASVELSKKECHNLKIPILAAKM